MTHLGGMGTNGYTMYIFFIGSYKYENAHVFTSLVVERIRLALPFEYI